MRAVNDAHMLYLAKWIICSIFTHRCSRCLWARWLFFRATDILQGGIRGLVSGSHQVKYSSISVDNNSRGKNNESPARLFLIQLSPRLFRLQELRCIRDKDESDSEAVSVRYTKNQRLQWDASKRDTQCSTSAHRAHTSLV